MSSYEMQRKKLVSVLERNGYLKSESVKNAILHIPRELFLPPDRQSRAYDDTPIPILRGQTISAPHMNAMMCELLDLHPGEKVLEIGTGSGYHAALLGYIVSQENSNGQVYSVERIEELVQFAQNNIKKVNLENIVTVVLGDGTLGYEEEAPYDKILVTAAGPHVPQPLVTQLAEGGKICIPIGGQKWSQNLVLVTKENDKISEKIVSSVMFVPLIGKLGFTPHSYD